MFVIVFTPATILNLVSVTMDRTLPEAMYPFRNKGRFYGKELLAPCPTPKMEDHPLSAVYDLFIQYIHSDPPRSSIRILTTRHAVVTGTNLSWSRRQGTEFNFLATWRTGFFHPTVNMTETSVMQLTPTYAAYEL